MQHKLFQLGFVKRFFWLKQKKIVLGVPKFKTKTFIFEYFPKNSFRNELNTPFLHHFDTHDLTCKNFHFVWRGSKNSKKNLIKIIWNWVCKKIFFIKAKKNFCTWCPKSAVPPRTPHFWNFFLLLPYFGVILYLHTYIHT